MASRERKRPESSGRLRSPLAKRRINMPLVEFIGKVHGATNTQRPAVTPSSSAVATNSNLPSAPASSEPSFSSSSQGLAAQERASIRDASKAVPERRDPVGAIEA